MQKILVQTKVSGLFSMIYIFSLGTKLIQSMDYLFSALANLQEDNEEQWRELDELGKEAKVGWIRLIRECAFFKTFSESSTYKNEMPEF
jgi:hypothetical protein